MSRNRHLAARVQGRTLLRSILLFGVFGWHHGVMDEKNLLLSLRQHRDEIIRRWAEQVKAELAEGDETDLELQNHIPDFLHVIESALKNAHGVPSMSDLQARAHGKQRHGIGFNLKTVVQEYAMLRNIILDVADAHGASISYGEIRRLSDCILAAIAYAVEEHGVQESRDKEKRHAEELQRLHERGEFERHLTGIVSHDLRNPLSAIALTAARLKRQFGDDERMKLGLKRIEDATDNALGLIDDLLDFARIRLGGGIAIQRRPCSLLDLAQKTADEILQAQPTAQIQITCRGNPCGAWDADRIRQVIQNLFINALKHAKPSGRVRVEISDDGTNVQMACTNAGPPIDQALLERIFEPMQQGTCQQTAKKSGLGLGLYIVRYLLRAHGGDVNVTSNAERGTTFTAHLPHRQSKAAEG